MRQLCLGGVLALALAGQASADVPGSLTIPDRCGDVTESLVDVNGQHYGGGLGRQDRYDIDHATLTAVGGGAVDVSLTVCGPIPPPDVFTSDWQVSAGISPDCWMTVSTTDDGYGAPTRGAHLEVDCSKVVRTQLGWTDRISTRYATDLPSSQWSLSGATITWHLSSALLEAAGIGSTWTDLRAHTNDGSHVNLISRDDVAAHGPGVTDDAASSETFEIPQ